MIVILALFLFLKRQTGPRGSLYFRFFLSVDRMDKEDPVLAKTKGEPCVIVTATDDVPTPFTESEPLEAEASTAAQIAVGRV